MRALIVFLFGTLGGAAQASPIAEVLCEATPDMLIRLETRMHATRAGIGVRSEEQLMEIWLDRQRDWVLVATYATGTSCIVAMGEDWQDIAPPAES